jgi:hypothetical protein
MSDFCENPFLKDTPVLIFSQGSEGDDWMLRNCDKCKKSAKCDLLKAILNPIDCYCIVPLHIARRIGIEYNALYQQGTPYSRCDEFDDGSLPF